ncbi:hypothetical protein FJTKL_06340 [Diaporthe vaccinii]|uniref:Isopenicillin N synthase-like Fe(2+) 2OG dioxygenase domain-containing protein n=1 Tax=Diaporthe vaccinii TaxID=105482 RepID=A0ABR4EWF1_9PEZI
MSPTMALPRPRSTPNSPSRTRSSPSQTDALTVNIADALQFLTGGYLKSSIHRVVAPPKTKPTSTVLGCLLQERGLLGDKILGSDGKPVKAGEWVKNRVIKNLGESRDKEGGDNEVSDIEIVKGVKVKYFD